MMIYILKLDKGRYYVGLTENLLSLKQDYQKHLNGCFSPWTKIYTPLFIERVIEDSTEFDEDKWMKIYMLKHGMGKVRGGSYDCLELSPERRKFLKKEIYHIVKINIIESPSSSSSPYCSSDDEF